MSPVPELIAISAAVLVGMFILAFIASLLVMQNSLRGALGTAATVVGHVIAHVGIARLRREVKSGTL